LIQKILGFLASTSIAILLTAAGLYFDATELTYSGGALFVLVASLWLLLRFNPRPDPKEREVIGDRQRQLIRNTRGMISGHTQVPNGRDFRDLFEASGVFPELRQHLSREYLTKFNKRNASISSTGGPMDPFAKLLLDELDRLEKKWGLNEP